MGNSAAYSFNREYNRPYRLKVEAVGANIKIYLDGVKVIDVTDTETPDGVPVYTDAGSFGFRTYNGSGCFSNVKISDAQGNVVFEESNLEEHGKTFGGDWSYEALPIDQSAGFQDTSVTSSIRITSGQEAGLVVKASGTDVTTSTFGWHRLSERLFKGICPFGLYWAQYPRHLAAGAHLRRGARGR